jgi:pilus assembly protein CpaE
LRQATQPVLIGAYAMPAHSRYLRRVGGALADKSILVTGSKGGVGTTTVTLNLGVQLALLTKKRVALLDMARPFGQISMMLDMEPRFTILDALERIDRLDEALLASMTMRHKTGVQILAGPLHAPMKAEQRQSVTIQALSKLVQIAERAFDIVVVDVGVVNAAEWSLVLRDAPAIILVAEPSLLALGMIERHMAAAAPAGIDCDRIHIVLNRWRQNDDEVFASFKEKHQRPILARLPNDYRQLTEALSLGMPLLGSHSNPLLARYRKLAHWVAAAIQRASGQHHESEDSVPAEVA